jgi:hypothetical protein
MKLSKHVNSVSGNEVSTLICKQPTARIDNCSLVNSYGVASIGPPNSAETRQISSPSMANFLETTRDLAQLEPD